MNEELHTSPAGQQFTREREAPGGIAVLTAYPDPVSGAEPYTIGFGHTDGVNSGDTCTPDEAEAMFQDDIAKCEQAIYANVTYQLTQGEFDALEDFIFNLGDKNFADSTLLKFINEGDMADADNEFQRWDKAGGHPLHSLLVRRQGEAQEFNSGDSA